MAYFAHMVHKVPQGIKQALCVRRLGRVCNPHGLRTMCRAFLGIPMDLFAQHSGNRCAGKPVARHTC